MNNIKKRIAALSIASTMLVSASGCKNEDLRYEINEETNQEELVGKTDLSNIYIVELKDFNNQSHLYLTKNIYCFDYDRMVKVGTNTDIVITDNNFNNCKSEYGEVANIIPFKSFIIGYDLDIKEIYTAEEINNIFEKIKKDYQNFEIDNDKQKVKIKIK